MAINLKLEAPWETYCKKLNALFANDPEVKVGEIYEGDDADYELDIEVSNEEKFVALDRTLRKNAKFGNVLLHINVLNEGSDEEVMDLYRAVFKGNPICKDVVDRVDQTGTGWVYVRFQPEVIQFYDDDMGDYNGNWSGLAQDIAYEVFENCRPGFYFCTADLRENKTDRPVEG